jgi:hypothetical protein
MIRAHRYLEVFYRSGDFSAEKIIIKNIWCNARSVAATADGVLASSATPLRTLHETSSERTVQANSYGMLLPV